MTESTDKQLPDEQQLDEYLKGDSSVSRQYRQLHSAEVPTELDRLVLRQAEDAVQTGPARGRPAWVRWTAPLAVAASAVLVLSIVIETGVRDETTVLQAPRQTAMQAKKREREESKAEETVATEQAVTGQAEHAPGFVPPAEVASDLAAEERLADRSAPQQIAPAAPPPPKLETPVPRVQSSAERLNQATQAARAVEPLNEAQTNEASPAAAESANDAPQPFTENRPPPPPVAAPAPTPRIMPARSISRAADEAEHALRAASVEEAARKSMDPEAWLKDIRELRKGNKQEQADREWQRFRAAFPHYEVAETDIARETKK